MGDLRNRLAGPAERPSGRLGTIDAGSPYPAGRLLEPRELVIEHRPATALRVLVLTPEYVPHAWGGLATYLHEVVSRLVARGARVDVVLAPTYAPITNREDLGGLPRALIVDAGADHEVHATAIEREWGGGYDVAFVQDPQAAPLAALLLSRSVCQRVVATAHLPTYSGFSYFDKPEDDARHQALEALLFRLSHRVVAPSRFAADVVLRVHRLDQEDLAVLTYGAPTLEPTKRARLTEGLVTDAWSPNGCWSDGVPFR